MAAHEEKSNAATKRQRLQNLNVFIPIIMYSTKILFYMYIAKHCMAVVFRVHVRHPDAPTLRMHGYAPRQRTNRPTT